VQLLTDWVLIWFRLAKVQNLFQENAILLTTLRGFCTWTFQRLVEFMQSPWRMAGAMSVLLRKLLKKDGLNTGKGLTKVPTLIFIW
jgi:hypothetical protein